MRSGIAKSPFIQIGDCRIIKQTLIHPVKDYISSPNHLPNGILVLANGPSASPNGGRGGRLQPRMSLALLKFSWTPCSLRHKLKDPRRFRVVGVSVTLELLVPTKRLEA